MYRIIYENVFMIVREASREGEVYLRRSAAELLADECTQFEPHKDVVGMQFIFSSVDIMHVTVTGV